MLADWPSTNHEPIDDSVDCKREAPQENLVWSREVQWIVPRQKVALDEIASVRGKTTARAQGVLQRCERTDPRPLLDEHAPHSCRHMDPRNPLPPQDEQAAEHHEQHESEMKDKSRVGHQAEYAGRHRVHDALETRDTLMTMRLSGSSIECLARTSTRTVTSELSSDGRCESGGIARGLFASESLLICRRSRTSVDT